MEPPNNRFKLPFFVLCAIVGIFVAAVGAIHGSVALLALGLVTLLGAIAAGRVVRSGRNPWWLRAPLDKR